jgi:hypothetical protein
LKRYGLGVFGLLIILSGSVQAVELDEFERADYDSLAPTHAPSTSSARHRLFLDVSNVTDFYDFETNATENFYDGTWIADTLRPTATILWDEKFRTQIGLVARKGYGDRVGFSSVDPWIQFLWRPARPFTLILGNLETPHRYHPALFMPLNYVLESPVETGAQALLRFKNWSDDLYFNYRLQDTEEHAEKFDVGIVHQNAWKFLRFNYQLHLVHEGGTLNLRDYSTRNDFVHLVGAGVHFRPARIWSLGARWSYLTSHLRQDATRPDANEPNPELNFNEEGKGNLYEGYTRIARVRLSYEFWKGSNYSHEDGDPWFRLPKLHLVSARWDVLSGRTFNLFLRYSAGFPGINDMDAARYIKSAVHMQASWQFSIPILEWTMPSGTTPEGQPVAMRWDEEV